MSKLDSPKTDTTISEIISDAVHDEATLKDEILWQWPKFDNTSKEQKETKEPPSIEQSYQEIMKNNAELKEYYKGYKISSITYIWDYDEHDLNKKVIQNFPNQKKVTIPWSYPANSVRNAKIKWEKIYGRCYKMPSSNIIYHKNLDTYRYTMREIATTILDLRAPMQLFDTRIKPILYISLDLENTNNQNLLKYDAVGISVYDLNFLDGFEMDSDTRKTYEAIKKEYLWKGPILTDEGVKYKERQIEIAADKSFITSINGIPQSYSVTYINENSKEITMPISKIECGLYRLYKEKYMRKDWSKKPYDTNPEVFKNLSRCYFRDSILFKHPDFMILSATEEKRRLAKRHTNQE